MLGGPEWSTERRRSWISRDLQHLRKAAPAFDQGEVAESGTDEAETGREAVDLERGQRQRGIATDRGEACEPHGAGPNGVDLICFGVQRGSSGGGGWKHQHPSGERRVEPRSDSLDLVGCGCVLVGRHGGRIGKAGSDVRTQAARVVEDPVAMHLPGLRCLLRPKQLERLTEIWQLQLVRRENPSGFDESLHGGGEGVPYAEGYLSQYGGSDQDLSGDADLAGAVERGRRGPEKCLGASGKPTDSVEARCQREQRRCRSPRDWCEAPRGPDRTPAP